MKSVIGIALCCVLITTAGCADSRRPAGVPETRSEPHTGAKMLGSDPATFVSDGELLAETASSEKERAKTFSVPPVVAAPPPAEAPAVKQKPQPKTPSVSVQKSQSGSSGKLTLPQLRAKYPDIFKVSGASQERGVALTFDDGPDERFTPQVLDVLKEHGVKATFFLLGKKAEAHPNIVKRIVREGHTIGNHSYGHPLFTKITVDRFAGEIEQSEEVLNRLAGYRPKLLRPPYGEINEEQLRWANSRGYVIVNWNVDSLDWKNLGEQQVTGNILGHTKAGSIVLQHSAGGSSQDLSGTVKALPGIITKLKSQGYHLVTVPELLHLSKDK
ncbi:polysaccharide deacetylase family protein [Paenibacillus hodogayensis]|uniref:Polysaccharide deacetylase family protein n=1 Tax=Paenibacillus hodogayensis TaxID=279208 RepID=A0ABV5VS68_9BACL